jgi:hypothetical protein
VRQPVYSRGTNQFASITADRLYIMIISHDENDIGPAICLDFTFTVTFTWQKHQKDGW